MHTPTEIPEKQEKDAWEWLVKLKVLPGSAALGKLMADLNIPDDTWIAVLRRDGHPGHPDGSTYRRLKIV